MCPCLPAHALAYRAKEVDYLARVAELEQVTASRDEVWRGVGHGITG